ncbi:MAG TPA: hypothetical protein VF365_02395 [Candidatus Limnocylindria bacterium]
MDAPCARRGTVDEVSRVSAHREHDRIWIIDVNGTRLVLTAFAIRDATDEQRDELRAMVESVRIEAP